jgi:hypothetical protein
VALSLKEGSLAAKNGMKDKRTQNTTPRSQRGPQRPRLQPLPELFLPGDVWPQQPHLQQEKEHHILLKVLGKFAFSILQFVILSFFLLVDELFSQLYFLWLEALLELQQL